MDSAKLGKLKEKNWRPVDSCFNCVHGRFDNGHSWGICTLKSNAYHHGKHDREHNLPAHKTAVCDAHEPNHRRAELDDFLKSPVTR